MDSSTSVVHQRYVCLTSLFFPYSRNTFTFYRYIFSRKKYNILTKCVTKGQLISKGLYRILNFPKKWTKKFDFTTVLWYLKSTCFLFVFWEKLKTPKRHFEINWPLIGTRKYFLTLLWPVVIKINTASANFNNTRPSLISDLVNIK